MESLVPLAKSSLVLEFIYDIQSSTFFNMYDSWNNNNIILILLAFPKYGLLFCAVNITADI